MTDLATLAIKVENGDVIKATTSLNTMAVASAKTEAATGRLTRRMALVEIRAREMDAAMGRSNLSIAGMAQNMGLTEEAAARLGKAFTAFSVVATAGFLGRKLLEETTEAQARMAQLEAALASTGGIAGRTSAQLDTLSHSLQDTSTFSDEAVKSAQAMLLTFDKIRGQNFDRATQAVADLAARMGGDLQGAAVQVGKALQDPTTGLTALRRSGVSFSESQIQVIKDLYDTGRVAEGQVVILKELEHQFGGSASAARDTLGGALKGLANDFGDLFEVSKGGSSGVVDAIHGLDSAVRTLGKNMGSAVAAGELVAALFAGRLLAGFAKATTAQVDLVLAGERAIAMQRAAAAGAVETATAQQTSAERVIASLRAEEAEVGRLIVLERERAAAARASAGAVAFQVTPTTTGATGPAADFYGRKQQEAQLTAATAARTAALEAETAALAGEEALELRRAQIIGQTIAVEAAATDATVIRTAAVVREGEVIAATSLLTRAGAAATGFFGTAIAALGGPIGATLILATALNAALDAYGDHLLKAAEQTDKQKAATENALATAHARAAAQRKEADDLSDAARKFAALSAQRTAELGKLTALNGAYRQSEVALAILGIRYDAMIQKSEDAKEHHGAQLTALNKLTDAITRQKVQQVLLNDELQREAQLRSTRAANADALRAANEKVITAGQDPATAERTQNRLDELNKLQDAERKYHDDIRRATAAQRADAKIAYDETVAQIHKVADLTDEAITRARRQATKISVDVTVGDTDAQTAGIRAMLAAELEGGRAVEEMRVQLAGNDAVQRALNDATARGTELTDDQAAALRRSAEEYERTSIAAEKLRTIQREVSGAVNQFFTDLSNRKNPFIGLGERLKAELIRSLSDAFSRKWTVEIGKILGIDAPATKQEVAGKVMDGAADKMLRAAQEMTAAASNATGPVDVATQRYESQFLPDITPSQAAAIMAQSGWQRSTGAHGGVADASATMGKEPSALGTAAGYGGIALGAATGGYGVGSSLYSTSHGAAGNYARGAVGGAATGALAGAAIGSVVPGIGTAIGAGIGALVGFTAGIFGVGAAAKASAAQVRAMREALVATMEGLRAAVSKDTLAASIAQAHAESAAVRKQIEDAYSGGGANSDTVRERNKLLAETNALEAERIRQLKEEAAVLAARQVEDYQERELKAKAQIARAQGNTSAADALDTQAAAREFALQQQREREDLVRSFGPEIDATEAATLAALDNAQAAEKQAYAQGKATDALNAFATAVHNAPTGFKIEPYIQEFAKAAARPTPTPINALPVQPLVPPTTPLNPPQLSVNPTVQASVYPTVQASVQANVTPALTVNAPPALPPAFTPALPATGDPGVLRDLLRNVVSIREAMGAQAPTQTFTPSMLATLMADPMHDLVKALDRLHAPTQDPERERTPARPTAPPTATPRSAPADRAASSSVTIDVGGVTVTMAEQETPESIARRAGDAVFKAVLAKLDRVKNATGGLNATRGSALEVAS